MVTLHFARSSARLLLATGMVASLAGCAARANLGTAAPTGAPAWVNRGDGAFNEGGRAFFGVGIAAGIRNPALLRTTADNRARVAIASAISTHVRALLSDYMASTSDMSQSAEEQFVENVSRSVVNMDLPGTRIMDHWQDPSTGTLYALARLDLEQAANSEQRIGQLNAQMRDYIRANAERAFDRLEQQAPAPQRPPTQ